MIFEDEQLPSRLLVGLRDPCSVISLTKAKNLVLPFLLESVAGLINDFHQLNYLSATDLPFAHVCYMSEVPDARDLTIDSDSCSFLPK